MLRSTLLLMFSVLMIVCSCATTLGQPAEAEPSIDLADRETALAESLTGHTLTGYFTVTGEQNDDRPPPLRGERYDLLEVRKLKDNQWLFRTRIRYGDRDVTLPLTLPIEWAGDTPVVVVDNIGFPGLGTYSARVLFHADHYAGHWQGADRGGHLFGVIEPTEKIEHEDADE